MDTSKTHGATMPSYQFPCALQLKQWGILHEVKCRLCEKYYKARNIPEPPDTVESVGHIQYYCQALQLPRIAIHHGIWKELMNSIQKSSTELNNASELRWQFPSALSREAHAEWDLYKILEHMGLHEILPAGSGKNRGQTSERYRRIPHRLAPSNSTVQTLTIL